METVAFNVYGLQAVVRTDLAPFAAFLRKNYVPFLPAPDAPATALDKAHVVVNFSAEAGWKARQARSGLYEFGSGIAMGDATVVWENAFGFVVQATLPAADRMEVHAYHFDLDEPRPASGVGENFQRSMRWAVHFPIFVLLRQLQGKRLLHAAAVARDGEAIVLAGLNGAGKSTLAWRLVESEGYSLLSDNFVLYDDHRIYGFPERLRLAPELLAQESGGSGVPPSGTPLIYGKRHLDARCAPAGAGVRPAALFVMSAGDRPGLQPLDPQTGGALVHGFHQILHEFPEHAYLGLLEARCFGIDGAAEHDLGCLADVPWFLLTRDRQGGDAHAAVLRKAVEAVCT